MDRLSRSIRGLSDILAKLDETGVVFRSATEPFDTATPAGRMMVQMLAVFAEFERATIIDRVINGMERKAARGEWCGGYRPYGYDLDPKTGYLAVVEHETAVVRRIFHHYTRDNVGAKAIATLLNTAGHRTKAAKPWSGNAVLVVLRNRVYLGEIYDRDRWYRAEQHHPQIIDDEAFTQAEQILIARGEDHAHHAYSPSDYLLAGLIVCEQCGKRYLGTAANGNKYRYRYYTCYSRHRYGTETCAAERLPADQLEAGVLTSLLDTLARTDLIDAAIANAQSEATIDRGQHTEELTAIDADLAKTNDAIDRYLTAFENGTMPEDTCAPRISELASKAKQLRQRREELQLLLQETPEATEPDPALCTRLHAHVRDALNTNNPGTTRQLIQALVHEVRVTGRHRVKPTFRVPTDNVAQAAGPGGLAGTTAATQRKVRPPTSSVPPAGLEPAQHVLSHSSARPGRQTVAWPATASGARLSTSGATSLPRQRSVGEWFVSPHRLERPRCLMPPAAGRASAVRRGACRLLHALGRRFRSPLDAAPTIHIGFRRPLCVREP